METISSLSLRTKDGDHTNALLEDVKVWRLHHRSPQGQRMATLLTFSFGAKNGSLVNALLASEGWRACQRFPWHQRTVTLSTLFLSPKVSDPANALPEVRGRSCHCFGWGHETEGAPDALLETKGW